MVHSKTRYRTRDASKTAREQKAREALLPQFPPSTPVRWFGEDVGLVVEHTPTARVKTTNGGNYDPRELSTVPLDERTR